MQLFVIGHFKIDYTRKVYPSKLFFKKDLSITKRGAIILSLTHLELYKRPLIVDLERQISF